MRVRVRPRRMFRADQRCVNTRCKFRCHITSEDRQRVGLNACPPLSLHRSDRQASRKIPRLWADHRAEPGQVERKWPGVAGIRIRVHGCVYGSTAVINSSSGYRECLAATEHKESSLNRSGSPPERGWGENRPVSKDTGYAIACPVGFSGAEQGGAIENHHRTRIVVGNTA